MHETLTLLRAFLSDPGVATVAPTARHGVQEICKRVRKGSRVLVEYGPGTGPISSALLEHIPNDGKLVLIERNPDLSSLLREKLRDPRVHVFCDSAENVQQILERCGEERADCVVSGIPFSHIPHDTKRSIMDSTKSILGDDGSFLVYQVDPRVRRYLREAFEHVQTLFIIRNIPPLFLFEASKNGVG